MIMITLLLCGVSAYLMYRDYEADGRNGQTAYNKDCRKSMLIYGLLMTVNTVGTAVEMGLLYSGNSFLFSMKRLGLLCVMWPVAFIDFQTYRIPNAFILFGMLIRLLLFPAELLLDGSQAWGQVLSEIIAGGALLAAAFLCTLMIKNAIGYGDMKLFVLMGMLLGLQGIWGAMFVSLMAAFIMALFVLLTKRKSKKDVIPFGPALVIGTYISVILTGM